MTRSISYLLCFSGICSIAVSLELGVFVSSDNEDIDWARVANQTPKISFALIRGTVDSMDPNASVDSRLDPMFVTNFNAAKAARLRVGYFHKFAMSIYYVMGDPLLYLNHQFGDIGCALSKVNYDRKTDFIVVDPSNIMLGKTGFKGIEDYLNRTESFQKQMTAYLSPPFTYLHIDPSDSEWASDPNFLPRLWIDNIFIYDFSSLRNQYCNLWRVLPKQPASDVPYFWNFGKYQIDGISGDAQFAVYHEP